jgi:hypothetical protein
MGHPGRKPARTPMLKRSGYSIFVHRTPLTGSNRCLTVSTFQASRGSRVLLSLAKMPSTASPGRTGLKSDEQYTLSAIHSNRLS